MTSGNIVDFPAQVKGQRRKSTPRPDPWYKRYPHDFQRGTRQLSIEARGAYNDILDLLYMQGGPIPADELWIRCQLHIGTRVWRRLRAELLASGKIMLTADGTRITNVRAEEEIAGRAEKRGETSTKLGGKVEQKSTKLAQNFATLSNRINERITTEAEAERESETETVSLAAAAYTAACAPPLSPTAAAVPDWRTLAKRLEEEAGPIIASQAIAPGLADMSIPQWWLDQGCDLDRDILPAIRAVRARRTRGRTTPIRNWGYFSNAVAENRQRRMQGLPAVDLSGADDRQERSRRIDEQIMREQQLKEGDACRPM